MTCSRVIFWEVWCRGVYSICSTIWMVQVSNCSIDKNFSKTTRPALGYRVSLPGLNWPEHETIHGGLFSADIRAELYDYSPCMPLHC